MSVDSTASTRTRAPWRRRPICRRAESIGSGVRPRPRRACPPPLTSGSGARVLHDRESPRAPRSARRRRASEPGRHPVEQRDERSGDHAVELGGPSHGQRGLEGRVVAIALGMSSPKIICTTVATASAIATDTPDGTSPNAASMPGSRTRATAGSASTPRSSDVIVMPSCAPTSGTRGATTSAAPPRHAPGPGRLAHRSERGRPRRGRIPPPRTRRWQRRVRARRGVVWRCRSGPLSPFVHGRNLAVGSHNARHDPDRRCPGAL